MILFVIKSLAASIFYHARTFLNKEADGKYLQPLVYGTAILEVAEFGVIILHEVEIQFVDHLAIIHLIVENQPHDTMQQRMTLYKEKVLRDVRVTSYQISWSVILTF